MSLKNEKPERWSTVKRIESKLIYVFSFDTLESFTAKEKLIKVICRLKGHPNGPVWKSSGFDPNMNCIDCGDEL